METIKIPGDPGGLSIVLLHGFGADAADLASLSEFYTHKPRPTWYFPNGPLEINLGGGMTGRAWFSVDFMKLQHALQTRAFDQVVQAFPPELHEIRRQVATYIQTLDISPEETVVGGFSQGAVLATELALHAETNYAGLLIFSGTLINREEWAKYASQHQGLAFFQSHGSQDPLLPLKNARDLEMLLLQAGLKGKLHAFQGGHEIPSSILKELNVFLRELIKTDPGR